jgi:hypothetical protein
MKTLELWGGPECTINRVAEHVSDRLVLTGHHDRIADLDRLAELNLAAVRYPLQWERIAPGIDGACDWAWANARLERLRALGLKVIIGLVHHGNGPSRTSLLNESFATGLGSYAGKVARRFPWIEAWTPVNEPVTTARFSALYGIWYPHHRDEGSCWRTLADLCAPPRRRGPGSRDRRRTRHFPLSWAAFARRLAEACLLDQKLIDGLPGNQLGWVAPRPAVAALASERRNALPALDIAIGQFAAGIGRTALLRCAPPVTQQKPPARPTGHNETMVVAA